MKFFRVVVARIIDFGGTIVVDFVAPGGKVYTKRMSPQVFSEIFFGPPAEALVGTERIIGVSNKELLIAKMVYGVELDKEEEK